MNAMLPQPPSSRQRRAPRTGISFETIALCLAISAVYFPQFLLARDELAREQPANTATRLLQDESEFYVDTTDDLYKAIEKAQAEGRERIVLRLPPTTLVLNQTVQLINISAVLEGPSLNASGPSAILSCGADDMTSLIEFSGSHLRVVGLKLQDCSCTGIRLISAEDSNSTVIIEDSVFQNFTRALGPDRVNASQPGAPADITPSTAALAVSAIDFAGSLTVRNSRFLSNTFLLGGEQKTRRRVLHNTWGTSYKFHSGHWRQLQHQHQLAAAPSVASSFAGAAWWPSDRRRRLLASFGQTGVQLDGTSPWNMLAQGGRGAAEYQRGGRRLQQQDDADPPVDSSSYSMPLLERARDIHKGLQVGPWADDLEAAFTVVCRRNGSCDILFEQVTFDNNTGVATGALYVMSDAANSCNVDLVNLVITNNKLRWQQALEESADDIGDVGASSSATDPNDMESSSSSQALEGDQQLLIKMAPWLTYTYPLINYFDKNAAGDPFSILADDTIYPSVTGRTLGAVVFHQRRSPWPGVLPGPEPGPMMRVTVTGGSFRGNDGAAIMSTATDFMELAGGNGSWAGGPPRHSVDVDLSGLIVDGHKSGWPAIWLRWARKVDIMNCTVTGSTSAIWLDEIRDSATVQDSTFRDNTIAKASLDYLSFLSLATSTVATQTSHVVKIQMTPLGPVPNEVTLRGCTFQDNAALTTAALYIRGSDDPFIADIDNQPGQTSVLIDQCVFSGNTCGSSQADDTCEDSAKALRIVNVKSATVHQSRFVDNLVGGLACSTIHVAMVDNCKFENNRVTYYVSDSQDLLDNSVGGAGVFGEAIGNGGFMIQSSTFTRNLATAGGGAVYMRFFGFLQVIDSRFDQNIAEQLDGGAIWMDISKGDGQILIEGSNFSSNVAGRNGGAISANNLASGTANIYGWYIQSSNFINNVAMDNPVLERGMAIIDQAGGGAVFAAGASFRGQDTTWDGNMVKGHAGGAIRIVDSGILNLQSCTFNNNMAVMGGAMALSRLSKDTLISECIFNNNTVVDPRAWNFSSSPTAPQLAFIDPGYGGAIYAFYSTIALQSIASFTGNSAKFGGAMAVMSSPKLLMQIDRRALVKAIFTVPVDMEVAESAGLAEPVLPYRMLFANNTALIGGAIYVSDTKDTSADMNLLQISPIRGQGETSDSRKFKSHPGILFLGNSANGGGALYLEGNGQIIMKSCRFVANRAVAPSTKPSDTALSGLNLDNARAKALPCYNGGGGGICVVGQANRTLSLSGSDLLYNGAKDGAGIYIAEGLDCIKQAGCYSVVLDQVNMTGNAAANRGGGVFWVHEGVLQISTCASDKQLVIETRFNSSADDPTASNAFNISLRAPVRKSPAVWYQQQTVATQDEMLANVGGAVRKAKRVVYASSGSIVVKGKVVYAIDAHPNAIVWTPDQGNVTLKDAYLNPDLGTIIIPDGNDTASSVQPSWEPVPAMPVVFDNDVLIDPAWYGVPYTELPCTNWNNFADTGPDVSSTPYFLVSRSRLDFYTSNTDIKINVTVHDWLGQNCTGGNDTQPLILVQADSPDVSGAITVTSVNGTAEFTALRLRAREGLHTVNMTGRSHLPVRELLASQVRIYVRPCAINEFASPKNLDECIPCDVGSYNFNVSSVSCLACPDNAHCSYPDPAACKLGTKCDPVGFLVPQDGYWHSNLFSEEVIECTNSEACTAPNRSAQLSEMQLTIWKAAQEIQFNAANLAADHAAKEALALQLFSHLDQGQRRRLLQDKAISDDAYVLLVLNATVDMLSDYLQNQCAPGYTGTLCGECMRGYGWRRIATCNKCPPLVLNNLYYALVTLLTLSLLAFTVHSSLKEQRRPGLLVGGISSKKDKAKQAGRASKVNSTGHSGLGVQASGPSQFHVILAAAAAEDAAAEAAPALALLREQRSCTAMGDMDLMAPYEYVDSVMAAARNQFSSAPGTPKGTKAAAWPFHVVDTAVRAHSVLSVPARASRWTCVEESRRIAVSFTKTDRVGIVGAGLAGAVTGDAVAAAGNSNHSAPLGGPVAEGMTKGYDNAVFSQAEGGGSTTTDIQPLEEIEAKERQQQQQQPKDVLVEVDEFGATNRVSPAFRLTPPALSRPVAEAKDYTNALYEDPQAPHAEIQDTSGGISGAGSSVRGGMPTISTKPLRRSLDGDVGGTETSDVGDVRDVLGFSHLVPQGVVMQSVPILHSNSPPRTPLHASVVSAMPGALELPTVAERVRIGEIPRRGKVLGRERAHQSTVVKIFVSYVQVLALLQNVPLEIPGVVDVYYRINNQAISYPGILVSLDCSLPHASISKAFVRVILTVLAPLYIFAGAVLFFLAFNVVDYYILAPYFAKHPTKRSRKRHLKLDSFGMHLKVYLGRQLIVTFIAIFFFFYPSVVQSLMAIFNCQDVNVQETNNPLANGLGLRMERIWSQDYGLTCYKRSHLALTLGLGVPGVLLIAIGWPLMSALFMTGKLTMLNNIQITEDMTSFFLADFKARFAWWESVIMLRKLFIAVIVTLVDGSTYAGVQLLLVICILVVAAGLHLVAMPYHHVYTNNLELVSLCTLLATLYFSLYFGLSSSISNGGRIAISVLILVINIIMVVVFIYYIIQAYFYAALLSSGLGDIDSETRRKLTAAEIQQRILENLIAQGSTTSYNQDGQQQQQQQSGERQRTSYNRVASLYATAMWYSMRVGSTTNKVLTKVKTLLRDPHGSSPPSREGSILATDVDGVPPLIPERPSAAGNARTSPGCNTSALADPEEGRGSATGRKRSMSGPGTAPAARPAGISLRATASEKAKGFGSAERSHSQSTPGIAVASTSQSSSSTGAGGANILGAGGSQSDEVTAAAAAAAASPRTAAQVISRACSAASLDNVSLPPFPTELPDASGAAASEAPQVEVGITPASPVVVTLSAPPPPPPPQPVVAPAAPAVMNPRPRAVRSPSRLAHVSGQANRSGELLPPPPSFPGRDAA
ncbi:hypothetical protein VaNZ11_002702 [Volvox africanus]|uniref:Tyrosine-protein kinase ephrin type A/B receptor-like domain-containing protein n=1 Tax=Volvox africanus TaxID=51714 RepID=A0ABQ5RTW6_9CHLO|nr:hypothetical protein VaNZ11_002702 [Volvox africanus]